MENSSNNKKIHEIEKQVDELIKKNNDKLNKIILKNKNNIYYLNKKSDNDKITSELLSKKIISKARKNLGKKPLKSKKSFGNSKDLYSLSDTQKNKKSFFKKREVKKNGQINKSISKITVDDYPYFEFQKLPKRKKEVNKTLFLNNKTQEKSIKTFPKEEIDTKKINKNFLHKNILDNTQEPLKINRETKIKNDKIFDRTKNFDNIHTKLKEKKSFFKKREVKKNGQINKSISKETINTKPYFKVENLPKNNNQDKNDDLSIDDKIQEFLEKNIKTRSTNEIENKPLTPIKNQIGEKEVKDLKKETQIEQPNNNKNPVELNLIKNDLNKEHVFFNEENSTFNGWSPKKTDYEKKAIIKTITNKDKIVYENLQNLKSIQLPKAEIHSNNVKLTDLGFTENDWEELDFYPISEPFAYVEILIEKENRDKCYFLVELALTEEEKYLLDFINDTLSKVIIDTKELEAKGKYNYLLEKLNQIITDYDIKINEEQKEKIYYHIIKTSIGFGKIDPLMKDSNIEDISCDGANVPIFLYHRKYGSIKSNIKFDDEDELGSFVQKLAQKCGKHISISEPMLDATMPDGSRIQMTLSDEITAKGSTFTIRKFREDPFSPPDLVELNTLSSETVAYMWIAFENGINTLFAGGTASGKTTTLNALSLFIPREAKIVSIEETREINLPHPNWIPGVARSGFGNVIADKLVGEIDMYDLMKAALRQRPEYIIVGEIRGKEAYVLFQAMATGHATYSTVHADSAQALIHRLEGKPINIPRIMLQSLDIVCFHIISRVKNIRVRRCSQIIEIIDIDPSTKEILTNQVFRWDPVDDKFVYSGKSYILERIRAEKDMSRDQMAEEIKNRMRIVEWMSKNNIREFKDVAKYVSQYFESPKDVINMIEKDAKINE